VSAGPQGGGRERAGDGRWVTADLGNSSLKLVLWDLGASQPLLARRRIEPQEPLGAALDRWSEELGSELLRGVAVALCSVAGAERTSEAREGLRAWCGADPLLHPDSGLENTCRQPHTVGRDRLYAARAAIDASPEGAVVLDAGTALTVDAVVRGTDGPRFLGGAIAPGPRLLAEALARGAAGLFEVEPRPPLPALGRESREALESGIFHGFRGAAAELARRVGLEAGLAGAPRWFTGGAAPWLLEPEPIWPGERRVDPDLVHRGLLAAARDPQRR
jgi:type III pantothenate kinase